MDPTTSILSIYPAAWAALFQGLAEGLVFGMVVIASLALLTAVLAVSLSGLGAVARGTVRLPSLSASPSDEDLAGIVNLAVVRQRRRMVRAQ